ncbi:uncharacterized protein V6R79_000823 [Siganus canaliculatus]
MRGTAAGVQALESRLWGPGSGVQRNALLLETTNKTRICCCLHGASDTARHGRVALSSIKQTNKQQQQQQEGFPCYSQVTTNN